MAAREIQPSRVIRASAAQAMCLLRRRVTTPSPDGRGTGVGKKILLLATRQLAIQAPKLVEEKGRGEYVERRKETTSAAKRAMILVVLTTVEVGSLEERHED